MQIYLKFRHPGYQHESNLLELLAIFLEVSKLKQVQLTQKLQSKEIKI